MANSSHEGPSNSNRYPVLSAPDKQYLSAPPTSVPSEHVFSTAGDILTDKRNRLSLHILRDNSDRNMAIFNRFIRF